MQDCFLQTDGLQILPHAFFIVGSGDVCGLLSGDAVGIAHGDTVGKAFKQRVIVGTVAEDDDLLCRNVQPLTELSERFPLSTCF